MSYPPSSPPLGDGSGRAQQAQGQTLALQLRGVTKHYRPPGPRARLLRRRSAAIPVLDGVDLDVPSGAWFALLGPNGAGKSTLAKMLVNLERPSAGEILVFGHPPTRTATRALIGAAQQRNDLDRADTVWSALVYHGRLYGMRLQQARQRAEELLEGVALERDRDQLVSKLSGGMTQRLKVARAMMHRPRLLILDEPTASVDAEQAEQLWQLIEAHREGTTVLLITHEFNDVERCDRMAFLSNGRIVQAGAKHDLLREHGVSTVKDLAARVIQGKA